MRLVECLNQSDIGNLRKIAIRHTIACPLYSKNTLLQEILNRFSDPQYVIERMATLSPILRQALEEIALEGRNQFAKSELLTILRRQRSATTKNEQTSVSMILNELLEEGILFETGTPSQRTYRCPTEILKYIVHYETQQLRQSVQTSMYEPKWIRTDQGTLARDAVTFLLFLARHEVKLTQEGVIFKRQQMQIFQLFEVQEEPLSVHVGFRFGYGRRFHDYPDRFAMIYDHLYEEGCIIEDESGSLFIDEVKSGIYMTESEESRAKKLFQFYMRTYRISIPTLGRIVSRIAKFSSKAWVFKQSLEDELLHFIDNFYYESKEIVYRQRILQMLVYLGFLAEGRDVSQDLLYQLTPLGERFVHSSDILDDGLSGEESFILKKAVIEPTFDILVPKEADSTYAFELQKIAEPISRDRMNVYRLTRESIYHALLSGWDMEKVYEFLRTISGADIPANVQRSIRDWCQEYGKVKLHISCVISCHDPMVSNTIEQLQPIAKRMPQRLSEHHLAFLPDDAPDLLALLLKLGYLVSYPPGMEQIAKKRSR